MKKYLLLLGFLLFSFATFSQVIPKPNPSAVGIGYKRLLADSTLFIPSGGALPRLGATNINRRSAIYSDTTNKKIYAFYPNDSSWLEVGGSNASIVKQTVKAAENITKGQAVYVSGANGTNILVSKASNTTEATSSKTLGLIDATVSTNGFANVITEGVLAGLNTSSATIGDAVWLGTSGDLIYGLLNKPYAPAHLVYIGVVTRVNSNNGEIFVKVQNGFELKEIHDISAQSPSNNNGLFYNASNSLWETKSIATALGYTPANAANYVPYSDTASMLSPYVRGTGTPTYIPVFTANRQIGNSMISQIQAPTIGQSYQGGRVAYILQPGDIGYDANYTKGFIVSNSDLTPAQWGCRGTVFGGAYNSAIGKGQENTTAILAGCSTLGIAARLCDAYSNDGYSDWYLPSYDELVKIYQNRVAINLTFSSANEGFYWSSTNIDNTPFPEQLANVYSLTVGSGGPYGKDFVGNVRAIRSFITNTEIAITADVNLGTNRISSNGADFRAQGSNNGVGLVLTSEYNVISNPKTIYTSYGESTALGGHEFRSVNGPGYGTITSLYLAPSGAASFYYPMSAVSALIGTSTGNAKLEIGHDGNGTTNSYSGIHIRNTNTGTGSNIAARLSFSGDNNSSMAGIIEQRRDGTDAFWIRTLNGYSADGRIYVQAQTNGVYLPKDGVAWVANSDERLKTDLVPIEDAANKVASLRSVTGRYKTDAEGIKRPFLIAQDLIKVLPEAVITDKINGNLGVSYSEVIPLLVAAIKEQQVQIQDLKSKYNALESRILALENK